MNFINPLADVKSFASRILERAMKEVCGSDFESHPAFIDVEPPRAPGISSTICFDIASKSLQEELSRLQAELGKKKAKKLLQDRSDALARSLADKLVTTLEPMAASDPHYAPLIRTIVSEGGYINFYYDTVRLSCAVLNAILACRNKPCRGFSSSYGAGSVKSARVMLEYSQPNTHKNFHVGHTRNVALGIAVSNILEFAGFPVVRANYIGDIGAHVIKCLWALSRFPDEFDDVADFGRRLGEFYALSDRAENDGFVETKHGRVEIPKNIFKTEIEALFARWEARESNLLDMWESTRAASLQSFTRIYGILNARFDHIFYESEVEADGKKCVKELLDLGIAELGVEGDYKGAVFVDFDKHLPDIDLRKMVLLRADGTSLYQTKELALARRKFQKYDIDRSIYVVATEQSFYFKQIFAILKLWGLPQADNCVHLPYEIVTLPEGKMSSRTGSVIILDDLMGEAKAKLRTITDEKGYASDVEDTVQKIAIGAIKFSMLNVDHNKVVVFDWEKALNFNGQAAPYILYMAVRARRILAEAGQDAKEADVDLPVLYDQDAHFTLSEYEERLVLELGKFPAIVDSAEKDLAPYHVTRFAFEISRKFGEFYRFCPVLKSDEPIRKTRLAIVRAFDCVLELCLELLGIEVPNAM